MKVFVIIYIVQFTNKAIQPKWWFTQDVEKGPVFNQQPMRTW